MKHASSTTLRNASLIAEISGRRVKRRSFFRRMIMALQLSRHRQARYLVRHYRHLIAEDFRNQLARALLDFNNKKESR